MEKEIGKITHFFNKINVGVIELSDTLKEGDNIHIKGATSDFKQKVKSMQIEHEKLDKAEKGQSIGLKVNDQVRAGDIVYKVTEDETPKVKAAKVKTKAKKAKAPAKKGKKTKKK